MLKWGILGAGRIARVFAKGLSTSTTGRLAAVASRTEGAAQAFAKEFPVEHAYEGYDRLLADPDIDAVYISLPNHLHALWTIRCAEAGKHILCEKPLTTNYAEAMTAIEACRANDVFMMEAFMYRCHPQTARLAQLIREGAIGRVRVIQAHFSFNMQGPQVNIRQQNDASGGGIMDVGCYCVSLARLIAGAANGQGFANPIVLNSGYSQTVALKAFGHIGAESRVDEWTTAAVQFPGDIVANLTCGIQVRVDSPLRIWGSQGHIIVPNPWFPGHERHGGEDGARILIYLDGQDQPQEEIVRGGLPLYSIEADTVARHIQDRQAPSPCMTWDDSLGNMLTLDAWRRDIGLTFDTEKPGTLAHPAVSRPLARRADHSMTYGHIPGVDKPVARLVMGTMIFKQGELPLACSLLDHYVEQGGNCLDTAHVYRSEETLGQWLKVRGVRNQMVIIAKGARGLTETPDDLTRQLLETLSKLGTDYVDLYLMHADNPAVPVGEYIDTLNAHVSAGRVRAFGGSNWTIERIEAANAYASAHGLVGFSASSPNLSLAAWNEPMWTGCLSVHDPALRAWYERSQMPLLAWSSQATGFFSGRFKPQDREVPAYASIARTWFNEANFERLERARTLAKKKGVTPAQIALSYVLCLPLNVFALIGPQTIEQSREALPALRIELTPVELRWLNLETDAL